MGILNKIFKKKDDPSSKRYRREMAERIAGHRIRYVTERRDDVDEVIGKEGSLSIRNGEFIVFASSDVLFRCDVDELQAWELLSKDGVVLTAPDLEHGGSERTIIVYYVYYR
ncbi:MAG: hypothetical protein MJ102_06550 [Clostridia bacterium]|nr:hypothetical protein [Clostridia bacterium]